MARVGDAGARPLIDRRQSHAAHQSTHPLATPVMTEPTQMPRHLPGSVKRCLHELFVDQPHEREVLGALARWRVIIAGPADRQEFALPGGRQVRMIAVHQFTPPRHAQRPEAFAKKSRSTTSWPILACKRSTSAALAPASTGDAFEPNVVVIPSIAAFFQAATWVRCTP